MPSTSMPIWRAWPARMRQAASGSLVLRSGILVLTTSINFALVSLATLVLLGSPEPDLTLAAFLRRRAAGGLLGDEVEGFVLVYGDHDGEDIAGLLLSLGVELFAEAHDVDPGLTKGRTDRGRGVRLPCRNLQLDYFYYFFCHGIVLLVSALPEDRLPAAGSFFS